MQQCNKRTTLRGNKLEGIEKGGWRAGGMLTPLSLSVGSQITVVSSWWQVGDQKEADTPCLYAIHKADVNLVWTLKNPCPTPNFKMIFNKLWQHNCANAVCEVNGEFNQPMMRPNEFQDQQKEMLEGWCHCCLHVDPSTRRTTCKGHRHHMSPEVNKSH